jgi:hypothetical protein
MLASMPASLVIRLSRGSNLPNLAGSGKAARSPLRTGPRLEQRRGNNFFDADTSPKRQRAAAQNPAIRSAEPLLALRASIAAPPSVVAFGKKRRFFRPVSK